METTTALPSTALTADRIAASRWWVSFACECDGRGEVWMCDLERYVTCAGCVCACGAPAAACLVDSREAVCRACAEAA